MPHTQFSIYSIQCSLVSKLALSNEQNKTSIILEVCAWLWTVDSSDFVLLEWNTNSISCKCFLIALQPFVHSFVTFKLIIEIENSEQTDACSEYYQGNTTSAKISPTSYKKQ
ncbi:hypothetical protein T07_8703 [Trichinella nelsoni]|uniref:Uncharacterized protein n=1 Tax=Trichinella nelsoni TaxID=6336 RepID=A0A0V0RTZ9_9BILA|nr:hypothetical protein T07_8703 [Trichinella nelsoni]